MSTKLDRESVIKNKKSAIQKLNALLEKYINDPTGKHLKKANLMAYWLKDYVGCVSFEESFNPKRNISYKRGDVIKVGFGFNVGNEYGGLHYAIVLDNKSDHASSTLTVIPLTSIKEETPERRHNVVLGNEIYRLLKVKCDAVKKTILLEQEQLQKDDEYFNNTLELANRLIEELQMQIDDDYPNKIVLAEKLLAESEEKLNELRERLKLITAQEEELKKISNEIETMKEGSVALVGQITTISKMRIYDPKKSKDVLYGIRLSEANMEKINNKVKELYVFEEKKEI